MKNWIGRVLVGVFGCAAMAAPPAAAQGGDAYARVAGQPLDRFEGHRQVGERQFHVLGWNGARLFNQAYDIASSSPGASVNPVNSAHPGYLSKISPVPALVSAALVPQELPDGEGLHSDGKEGAITAGMGLGCDGHNAEDNPNNPDELCLQYDYPGADEPLTRPLASTEISSQPDPDGRVALTVGDFLGKGYPQVAVAWTEEPPAPGEPAPLHVEVFRVEKDGSDLGWVKVTELPAGLTVTGGTADFRGFEIAAGDVERWGREQLILYRQGKSGATNSGVFHVYDVHEGGSLRLREQAFTQIPHLTIDRDDLDESTLAPASVPHSGVQVSLATPRVNPTPRRLGEAEQVHYDQLLVSFSSATDAMQDSSYRDIVAVSFPEGRGPSADDDVLLENAAGENKSFLGSSVIPEEAHLGGYLGYGTMTEAGDLDGDGVGDLAGATYNSAGCVVDYEVIFGKARPDQPAPGGDGRKYQSWEIGLNRGFTQRFDPPAGHGGVFGGPQNCKLSNLVVADARTLQQQLDANAFIPKPDDPEDAAPGLHAVIEANYSGGSPSRGRYLLSKSLVNDDDGSRVVLEPDPGAPKRFQVRYFPQMDFFTGKPVLAAAANEGVYRVGEPEVTSVRTQEPLVILNASPTHFDIFDGNTFDPHFCWGDNLFAVPPVCDFSSTYTQKTSQSTEVSTTINDEWAVSTSAETGGNVGVLEVKATLEATVGEQFSNTRSSEETRTVEVSATAKNTDQAYVIDKQYDIVEYPIYKPDDSPSAADDDHVMTIRPVVTRQRWIDVNSPTSRVRTNHQPGNLLSYIKPEEIAELPFVAAGTKIFGEDEFQVTPTSDFTYRLTQSRLTQAGQSETFSWGVGAGASAEVDFIVKASLEVKAEYKHEEIRTAKTTVGEETSIEASLAQLDGSLGQMNYFVRPFSYFTPTGALVLDYAIEPEQTYAETGVPNFWDRYYGHFPDPTMILPNYQENERFGERALTTDALQFRTRDMRFREADGNDCLPETNPAFAPEPGDEVCVDVTLRNYSLADTPVPAGTVVGFYDGDPDVGGKRLGEAVLQSPIPARESRKVLFHWEVGPDFGGANQRIFARVDDNSQLREIKEDNNKGFDMLRVRPGGGAHLYSPRQVFASRRGDDTATVFWSAPSGNLPTGAQFEVRAYRNGDPGPVGAPITVPLAANPEPGHRYETTVKVPDAGRYRFAVFTKSDGDRGPVSDPSEPIELQPGAPSAPRNVEVTGANPQILSWEAPEYTGQDGGEDLDITGYVVTYRDSNDEATVVESDGDGTSIPVRNLRCGETYTVTVAAQNERGTGPESAPASVEFAGSPPAPANVAATVDPDTAAVSVTWDAVSDESCGEITGYEVRAEPAGQTVEVDAGAPDATFEGLPLGITQTFTVVALSGDSASEASDPSTPVLVARRPGAPEASAKAQDRSITIHWSPPSDHGGAAVTGYVVRLTSPEDPDVDLISGQPVTARSHTFSGLKNGREYTWSLRPVNPVGEGQEASGSATPVGPPSAPRRVTAVGGDGEATVRWDAPEDTGGTEIVKYIVTGTPDGDAEVEGTERSATVTGLTNGERYTFTVKAESEAGTGPASSDSREVLVAGAPGAPPDVTADSLDRALLVHWGDPEANGGPIEGFRVTARASNGESRTVVVGGAERQARVGNLRNGVSYDLEVVAFGPAGDSPAGTGGPATPKTVDSPLVKVRKVQRQNGSGIKVRVRIRAHEPVAVHAGASVKFGGASYRLKPWSGNLKPRKAKRVVLRPKRKRDARAIAEMLGSDSKLAKRVKAQVVVKFRDSAGYEATRTAKTKLR